MNTHWGQGMSKYCTNFEIPTTTTTHYIVLYLFIMLIFQILIIWYTRWLIHLPIFKPYLVFSLICYLLFCVCPTCLLCSQLLRWWAWLSSYCCSWTIPIISDTTTSGDNASLYMLFLLLLGIKERITFLFVLLEHEKGSMCSQFRETKLGLEAVFLSCNCFSSKLSLGIAKSMLHGGV